MPHSGFRPGSRPSRDDFADEFEARAVELAGDDAPRFGELVAAMEAHHPSEPHQYLWFLAVDPNWQGRGIGSALLLPMLERCDRKSTPAYLEATSLQNVRLYERNGFDVVGTINEHGGAPLWSMWREPRAELKPVQPKRPAAQAELVPFDIAEHDVAIGRGDRGREVLFPPDRRAQPDRRAISASRSASVATAQPRCTRFFDDLVFGNADELEVRPPAGGPHTAPLPSSAAATPPHCSASFQNVATASGSAQSRVTQVISMPRSSDGDGRDASADLARRTATMAPRAPFVSVKSGGAGHPARRTVRRTGGCPGRLMRIVGRD